MSTSQQEVSVLQVFVREAASLAAIALFVAMVTVWAQVIGQL